MVLPGRGVDGRVYAADNELDRDDSNNDHNDSDAKKAKESCENVESLSAPCAPKRWENNLKMI